MKKQQNSVDDVNLLEKKTKLQLSSSSPQLLETKKKKVVKVKSPTRLAARTFDDILPEDHKEVSIKVLKHWLKNYYKLDGMAFPQSSILKQEELISGNTYPGDSFCLKLDIEDAINTLPLRLKKIIFLHYIIGFPVGKICTMLGYRFRVDLYRRLEECFEALYAHLGTDWLRSERLSK